MTCLANVRRIHFPFMNLTIQPIHYTNIEINVLGNTCFSEQGIFDSKLEEIMCFIQFNFPIVRRRYNMKQHTLLLDWRIYWRRLSPKISSILWASWVHSFLHCYAEITTLIIPVRNRDLKIIVFRKRYDHTLTHRNTYTQGDASVYYKHCVVYDSAATSKKWTNQYRRSRHIVIRWRHNACLHCWFFLRCGDASLSQFIFILYVLAISRSLRLAQEQLLW